MTLITSILIILLAFFVMTKVVDGLFLKSLDNISNWLKLTPSVAGATLLAVGTSAPELSTTMFALFLDGADPATGLGTVVGSAIFQILVVVGFASLVKTTYLDWKPVVRDGIFYGFSVALLIFVVNDQVITSLEGGIMILFYVLYLIILFVWTRFVDESKEPDPIEIVEKSIDKEVKRSDKILKKAKPFLKPFIIFNKYTDKILSYVPNPEKNESWTLPVFFGSLAVIAYASYWLVLGAEDMAAFLGIPPAIIALTILAGGSSIPELISSYIIAKEGRGDMAISNAIGSNTFDILISLGLPVFLYSLLHGGETVVDSANITSSLILLFATLIAVLIILAARKFKIGKKLGFVLIGLYVLYVIGAYSGVL